MRFLNDVRPNNYSKMTAFNDDAFKQTDRMNNSIRLILNQD